MKEIIQSSTGITNPITFVKEVRGFKEIPCLPAFNGTEFTLTNFTWTCRQHGEDVTNRFIHRLNFFCEKRTGQLIWLETPWPTNVSGTRFPSYERYEKQLPAIGQKIVGIPTSPPRISLQDAMQYAMGFATAKQIIVYHVLESYPRQNIAPRPVWIIHAWGCGVFPISIPPGVHLEKPISEDALNHLRTIVNADTGQYYGSDSIPQPKE